MTSDASLPNARITDERLHAVLEGVQAATGLDVTGARLIKFTNNAVFLLPRVHVVARIAGSATMANRIMKVIKVARWLELASVPAVRLLDIEQPLVIDNLHLTLWHAVSGGGLEPSGADLARILRQWHQIEPPRDGLPGWNPLEEIRSRLAEPDGVDAADITYLYGECDRIEAELGHLRYELPAGPIHGDAFMGNLVGGNSGPVICDFDSSCEGPREWDFVPLAVGKLRFDYPRDDYGDFASEYGYDVTQWSGFPVLRRLRELKLITSLVPVLGSRDILRPQWQTRMNSYRRGDQDTRWSTYVGAA